MNTARIGICALAFTLALTGCKLQQDPMADQSDNVRNGIPPQNLPPKKGTKPVPRDALMIETKDYFSFETGVRGEYEIKGFVLVPLQPEGETPKEAAAGVDYNLEITNLEDFEGATFDQKTGVFTWTPGEDYVDRDLRIATLQIRMDLLSGSGVATTKQVSVHVTRTNHDPMITAITDVDTTTKVVEGTNKEFTVTIHDPDSTSDVNTVPRLVFLPTSDHRKNAGPFVKVNPGTSSNPNPKPHPTLAGHWVYALTINTGDVEITKTTQAMTLHLQAVTRFNRGSAIHDVTFSVITALVPPLNSWKSDVAMIRGTQNTMNFVVFENTSAGTLKVTLNKEESQLGQGANFFCQEQTYGESNQVCSLTWTPNNDSPKRTKVVLDWKYTRRFETEGIEGRFANYISVVEQKVEVPQGSNGSTP